MKMKLAIKLLTALCLIFSLNTGLSSTALWAQETTVKAISTPTDNNSEVLFTLSESINIYNAFEMLKQMKLNLKELSGFYFEVAGTEADIPKVQALLKTKSYLHKKSDIFDDEMIAPLLSVSDDKKSILIKPSFFNIQDKEMDDWLQFMTAHRLKPSFGGDLPYKWGIALLAEAEVETSIVTLKSHPLVGLAKRNVVVEHDK